MTEPGRALPLTDEEAAVVRQIVTNGLPGDHEIGNVTVARLLATLDAARKDAAAGWAAALEESAGRLAARAAVNTIRRILAAMEAER